MATSLGFKIRTSVIFFLLLFIVGFSFSRTSDLRNGVRLTVEGVINGSMLNDPLVTLHGIAKHATVLEINGKSIQIDQKGFFSDTILLSPGYSIITVHAKDKFDTLTTKEYRVYVAKNTDNS